MKLRITQPDTGIASTAVRISFNQQDIGVIGPGGAIDQEIPHDEHFPYEVTVVCGMHRATYHGHGDIELQVHWSLRTCTIELRKIIDS